MKGLFAYSGLTTKIRAMQSNLISRLQYEEIANLKSVPELFAYLQQHQGYRHLFANMEASTIHRGDIEALLRFSTFRDFSKIYNFANGKQRKYLDLYFMKYEIEVLKRYMRNILDNREDLTLSVIRNDFELHSKINTSKVAESATMEEFINNLKDTRYYEPLSELRTAENLTLFDYEMRLDQFLYAAIWKVKDTFFKGVDAQVITNSYGFKIDMMNIMWLYRGKKYYNIGSPQILSLLIPISYKLKTKDMKTLADAEDLDKFYSVLNNTYYKKYFEEHRLEEISMEELEESILYTMHVRDYQKNPYSIAAINTYLFLKEREISNLIKATECIRYGYPAEEILQQLV